MLWRDMIIWFMKEDELKEEEKLTLSESVAWILPTLVPGPVDSSKLIVYSGNKNDGLFTLRFTLMVIKAVSLYVG